MRLARWQQANWKAYITELQKRDDCKCTHPVKVRAVNFTGEWKGYHGGITEPTRAKPYWLIEVGAHLNYDQRLEYLIHEWAHCLDGPKHTRDPHSETWGVCYSIVYRAVAEITEKINGPSQEHQAPHKER